MKNNRTVFRRILSLFLAIALCLAMQDMAVFAATVDISEDELHVDEVKSAATKEFSEEELHVDADEVKSAAAAKTSEEELHVDGTEGKAADEPVSQPASASELQKVENAILRGLKQGKAYVGLEGYQVTAKEMQSAFLNPEIRFPQYFVSGLSYDSKPDTGMVTGVTIQYSLNAQGVSSQRTEMEQSAAEIVNTIRSAERELKDFEKAWLVNQWLAKICELDTRTSNTAGQTAYDALVKKKAKDKGYAAAYQYIMRDLLGIPCLVVKNSTQNVFWNMVKIDGKYYHVDVRYSRHASTSYAAYGDYFLLTDEELKAKSQRYSSWTGPYDMEKADGSSYQEKSPLWMKTSSTDILGNGVNSKGSGITYYEGYFYYSIVHNIYRVTDLLNYDPAASPQLVCETDGQTKTWDTNRFMACWISICEFHDCLYFNGRQRVYRLNLKNDEETKISSDENLSKVDDLVVEDITTATVINDLDMWTALSDDSNYSGTWIFDFDVKETQDKGHSVSFQLQRATTTDTLKTGISCYYLRTDLVTKMDEANPITVTGADGQLQVGQQLQATANIKRGLATDYHNSARPVYRWYRDGFVICKNTTGLYTTTEEDIGKTLRVAVTCDNFTGEVSKEVGAIPKLTPTLPIQLPTGITLEQGSALKNAALPEGFEWKNPDTILNHVGKQQYPASYCPDPDRYGTIDASVEVEVKECSHAWGTGSITTPAKCQTPGVRTFTCSKCGTKKTEPIPAKGTAHRWGAGKVIKKSTCTQEGTEEFTCILCHEKKTEPIEKAKHTWKQTGKVTKEPAANAKGTFTTACSVCKKEKTENLLYAKTGNFTSGMTYVKVRSSAKSVNDNNVIAKLKKNVAISVFETGSTSTWTKICYNNRTAYIMSDYVVQSKSETPKDETPKDETPKDETPNNETPKTGSKVTAGKATYKVTKKNTVEFSKVKSSASGTVTIPASIKIKGKTYKVTSVAAKAMKNNKKVKKVIIGSNVTKIGSEAFSGCKNLKNITIKSSKLKSVGRNAIKNINKKAAITCPKKKKAAYKKLFKSSTGYKKTMKIK